MAAAAGDAAGVGRAVATLKVVKSTNTAEALHNRLVVNEASVPDGIKHVLARPKDAARYFAFTLERSKDVVRYLLRWRRNEEKAGKATAGREGQSCWWRGRKRKSWRNECWRWNR